MRVCLCVLSLEFENVCCEVFLGNVYFRKKNGISGRVIKEKLTPTRGYKNLELCELGDLPFPAVSGASYSLLTATTLFSEARTVFFLRNFSLPLFFVLHYSKIPLFCICFV